MLAGGHLIFTLEKGECGLDYKLNIHGRYSHDREYVETAMVGSGLRICEDVYVLFIHAATYE